ncbi:hypothetical protein SARC_02265 [Sphaeroforma arctica JP610]|uniref:Uncharacterized protein n=1 Tax=Sphaeroforma arctica JP610 TaxID=667725 RepID=A0A0L0GBB3_9EUKA|nr:hypothetical protein SARC_02265 [Sphaeroforma arctica JP610]KNC85543.1 hypothetical protein SARC_02265 [Sphaeroforma arctica JP610]|eukprot:XP_014159445.1 hypothetical protein SARC_02265 [Sphaeroforma arctica JP610]
MGTPATDASEAEQPSSNKDSSPIRRPKRPRQRPWQLKQSVEQQSATQHLMLKVQKLLKKYEMRLYQLQRQSPSEYESLSFRIPDKRIERHGIRF